MSEGLPVIDARLAAGEGWVLAQGRDAATGASRLLVVLAAADLGELRRALAVAGSVAGRHLAEVVDAVALSDGSVGVVFVAPGGPSLAEVMGRRALLSAGEVVTLVAPLARTLAALHARGVFIADVSAQTLRLTSTGQPVLVPVGIGAQQTDDVRALAALAARLLDRSGTNAGAVGAALDAAAGGSVDADGLATALLRATPAQPVRVAMPAPVPAPVPARARGRRRRRARARPAMAILAVAVVAIGLGGAWGRHGGGGAVLAAPPLAPVSTASPTAPSWLSVMSQLERTRARAYADADVALLGQVYAVGSPTGTSDRRLLDGLARHHERAAGLQAFVEAVEVIAASDRHVALAVTDAMTAYDVLGRDGRVLRHGIGRPSHEWHVTLVRTTSGWRIWSVRVPTTRPT